MKRIPVIEELKDEIKFTDEYGATIIVEMFEIKGEQWVRILVDNDKQEVKDFLEKHDEGVHIPLSFFKYFCMKTYEKGVENGIDKRRKEIN